MSLSRWASTPQTSDVSQEFRYGVLKSFKTGIRLAQILPGSGSKGIAINLVESFVSGPSKLSYNALSYTWGDTPRDKNIMCNGRRLAVTSTLLEALHRFRDPHHLTTLWIDQICICQDRIRERNQQVQMMGEIFKSANKVVVWLGDDYDDSRAGMQLAKQLLSIAKAEQISGLKPSDLELHGLPKPGHRRWKALALILRRPWFWRTWIVQEVVLNEHVELVLGSSMLTWDELEAVIALLEGPAPRFGPLGQAISPSELPFSRINRIRLRHRRLLNAPKSSYQPTVLSSSAILTEEPESFEQPHYAEANEEDDPELLDLLLMSRGLGATDPRDKIYALLGLSRHDILPDYSMSPESVFTDFALQTVGAVTNLLQNDSGEVTLRADHRDVRRAMVMLACAGRQNQRLSLPSWVPDWTVTLASRPLIFGLGQRYGAGGTDLGLFDWSPDWGLQLDGILVDTVQTAGTVRCENEAGADIDRLITDWWLEAQQIALQRIARSPGSTVHADAFEALRRRLFLCPHGYYVDSWGAKRRGSLLDENEGWSETTHNATQTITLGPTRGRVFMASSTGYLGLAPYGTCEGDIIFVVRGADVPFILRPQKAGYELIGEAYVQGIMDGEALSLQHLFRHEVRLR